MTEDQKTPAQSSADAPSDEPVVTGVVEAEADPHGATVVAVVGDESGVAAVAAMDTDYFNTVLAAEFASPDAARAAYSALQDAESQGALRIDGVLAVHADTSGQIHVDTMTDHSTKTGLKWGAVAGLALGVIFPPAIIASTVAWGTVGAAIGKLRNVHHKSQVADELEGSIGPDNSGIIVLLHDIDVPAVQAKIPEATKVTTAEVDEAAAKDITEAAKEAAV
jgi:uncharacterized membrane protein